MEVHEKIHTVTDNIKDLLLYKNELYGNAALSPTHIFNKTHGSSINVRIDDKLARIKNSKELRKNDVVDLLGYIILKCVELNWLTYDEFKD